MKLHILHISSPPLCTPFALQRQVATVVRDGSPHPGTPHRTPKDRIPGQGRTLRTVSANFCRSSTTLRPFKRSTKRLISGCTDALPSLADEQGIRNLHCPNRRDDDSLVFECEQYGVGVARLIGEAPSERHGASIAIPFKTASFGPCRVRSSFRATLTKRPHSFDDFPVREFVPLFPRHGMSNAAGTPCLVIVIFRRARRGPEDRTSESLLQKFRRMPSGLQYN